MKRLLALILAAVFVIGMAACGTEAPPAAQNTPDAVVSENPVPEDTSTPATPAAPGGKDIKDIVVAVSLGWMENESGQRQRYTFETELAKYGITNYSIVDANYDAKKQSEQIEAFISAKPDVLFITPSDPVGIAEAVKHACDAGIPVFSSDGLIPGAAVTSTVMFDNYKGGIWTMQQICERLDGKGKIAIIDLPSNEGWDERGHGAKFVLKQYPDIEVVQTWSWDSTGAVTPRMAIDNMLTACPNVGDLDAIWCAWDGAVFEGIQACEAAGRNEILFTGSDGGEHCFEVMKGNPNFIATCGESIYTMGALCVEYAVDYLNGKSVPRIVMVPSIGITNDMIVKAQVPAGWSNLGDYDIPGNYSVLGWQPTL
ncbi:MAG: sugar ABC transporter substrate-binding protein [Oscillospiraceae bacterium]|jgi:ribose transport system substrate-binding protein|nr:sugar ABC transporter substrate-binding protein [Oscillospiraceae bacterium]